MNVMDIWGNGQAVLRAKWYLRHATHIGNKTRVWGRPAVVNHGEMLLGERLRLVSTVATTEIAVGRNGRLEIGESVFINYGSTIAAQESIYIGPNCNIGTFVMMMDNSFHRLEPERRLESPESAPIVLEENVWLGGRVIVLPGVCIGAGSAVGAGSVVTKDIPPRSLAVGVPAKVIREL